MIFKDFFANASEHKNDIAITYLKKNKIIDKTFDELLKDINKMANYFKESGVKKSDAILLFLKPSYEFYLAMMACFCISAKCIIIDSFKDISRVNDMTSMAGVQYVFTNRILKKVKPFIKPLKPKITLSSSKHLHFSNEFSYSFDASAIALVTFTSGTTGKPKMITRTISNLLDQLEKIKKELQSFSRENCIITMLPVYVLASLAIGSRTVLFFEREIGLKKQLAEVAKRTAADSIIASVSKLIGIRGNMDNIKNIYTGGSVIYLRDAIHINSKFGNANIRYIYGSSENFIIAGTSLKEYLDNLMLENTFCIGEIDLDTTLKIELIDELVGEIIITKDNKIIKTGDLGYIKDNKVYLVGRKNFSDINSKHKYYNYLIEQEVMNKYDIKYAAFVNFQNKNYLCIETKRGDIIQRIQKAYPLFTIKIFKRIPRDYRHNYKSLYDDIVKKIGESNEYRQ